MMTVIRLSKPEELKVLLKDVMQAVSPPGDVVEEYATICFCLTPSEYDSPAGSYLMVGLCLSHSLLI